MYFNLLVKKRSLDLFFLLSVTCFYKILAHAAGLPLMPLQSMFIVPEFNDRSKLRIFSNLLDTTDHHITPTPDACVLQPRIWVRRKHFRSQETKPPYNKTSVMANKRRHLYYEVLRLPVFKRRHATQLHREEHKGKVHFHLFVFSKRHFYPPN